MNNILYIIELKYTASLQEIEAILDEHKAFLKKYYDKGLFLTSGPKRPREGGAIICKSTSLSEIEKIYKEDPFYINNFAEYRVIAFEPLMYDKCIEHFIEK